MTVGCRPSPHRASPADAAGAVRRLAHALVERRADAELLEDVRATATSLGDRLAECTVRPLRTSVLDRQEPDQAVDTSNRVITHFDLCPVSGAANPLSIDVEAERDGETVLLRAVLGPGHEGVPGRAHGGIVAALLDDALGFYVSGVLAEPALVVDLRIRYLAAVPVGVPLSVRCSLLARRERKVMLGAELDAGADPLVRATGLHICLRKEPA